MASRITDNNKKAPEHLNVEIRKALSGISNKESLPSKIEFQKATVQRLETVADISEAAPKEGSITDVIQLDHDKPCQSVVTPTQNLLLKKWHMTQKQNPLTQ